MTATATLVDDFAAMRSAMVASQLRTTGVTDPRVLTAMAEVPREAFVPADKAAVAYSDRGVELGGGRWLNMPLSTARLLNEAALQAGDRVLLLGAATGYSAALLARIVAAVTAIDSDATLVASARTALADAANVALVEGAMETGHAAGAPYDVLIVDGAVEELSLTLVSQLAEGGRIVTGLIDRGVMRLASGNRAGASFALAPFADIDSARLPGFTKPKGFTF